MLKLFTAFTLVAIALARPQQFQLPAGFTLAAAPQGIPQQQHVQQQHVQHSAALTAAGQAPAVPQVPPVNFVSGNTADGSSVFGFQTVDGQTRRESVGADGSVQGSYSYVDAHGQTVTVNYIADQQGFRTSHDPIPVGGHRPATTPAPQPQPAAPQHTLPTFTFQLPQAAPAAPAPAPATPAPAHSFTPFFSPLPANTLPLGHFGFQPLAAAQPAPQAAVAAPPQQAPVQQAAPALTPIAYSFNTGRR